MACDLCNKRGRELVDVTRDYQTEEVQAVCSDCATLLNDHLWKIRALNHNILIIWMKKFIAEHQARHSVPPTN